jgi:hypothetical protein
LQGCVLRRRGDCLKQFADEQEIVILLDKFDQSVTFNKIPRTNLCEAYQSPNLAGLKIENNILDTTKPTNMKDINKYAPAQGWKIKLLQYYTLP